MKEYKEPTKFGECFECGDNTPVEILVDETYEQEGGTSYSEGPEVYLCDDGEYRCEECLYKLKAVQCDECGVWMINGPHATDEYDGDRCYNFCKECAE